MVQYIKVFFLSSGGFQTFEDGCGETEDWLRVPIGSCAPDYKERLLTTGALSHKHSAVGDYWVWEYTNHWYQLNIRELSTALNSYSHKYCVNSIYGTQTNCTIIVWKKVLI